MKRGCIQKYELLPRNAELHYILGAVVNCAEKKGNNVYSKVFSWVTGAVWMLSTKINPGVKDDAKDRMHLQLKDFQGGWRCI